MEEATFPHVTRWLDTRGWRAFEFQREVWQAVAEGRSGMLHATTGAGKTYAVWLGMLEQLLQRHPPGRHPEPLRVVWLTPMRALAADTAKALTLPLMDLAPTWTLGMRTGDTASAERARQDRRMPTVLVTTPESLTLMLTREKSREELTGVEYVAVDEWHELIGSKRGVQAQLALARLRRFNPGLVTWGLSATMGNLEEAMQVLTGPDEQPGPKLVRGRIDKTLTVDTLIPPDPGKYSWAGHLGARMQLPVVEEIAKSSGTTLVFTNVRSQAEIWYQLLLEAKPEWAGEVALHHGSLDKATREWVENGLKQGTLRAVVATSSLDLGVDFLPVERVLQVGSAKGIARMLQRAGRSGHAPGRPSRLTLVPTNTLEIIDGAAARHAIRTGLVEKRVSPQKPFDVLVQHIVTIALGTGFTSDELYEEVKTAWAYRDLKRSEFDWALAFCERGGESLTAYPEYHRIRQDEEGIWRVPDRGTAKRRLSVGTIVSDAAISVKYLSGATLGTMEEGFIARLKAGDCFFFAGRLLEFVRLREMVAYVKKATKNKGTVPTWQGAKMAFTSEMSEAILRMLEVAAHGEFDGPELEAARPMLQTQARLSKIPTPSTLLVESFKSREGWHLYVYPFAGRNVHIGLGSLLAWRLARDKPNTFSISINDYGFELVSAEPFDLSPVTSLAVFSTDNLMQDVLDSLNSSELALRRFREIARVSGLIQTGYPGQKKSARQLQASSGLFYEVFRKYDKGNLLLSQADNEVLSQELEISRLREVLETMRAKQPVFVELKHPSPMSLPLMVERFREKLTTEQLSQRLDRILRDMERDTGG